MITTITQFMYENLNLTKNDIDIELYTYLKEFTVSTKGLSRYTPPKSLFTYLKNVEYYNKPIYRRTSINRDPAFYKNINDIVEYPLISCSTNEKYVNNFLYAGGSENNKIQYELKITILPKIKGIYLNNISSFNDQFEMVVIGKFIIVDKIIKNGFPCELILKQFESPETNYKITPLHTYKKKQENTISPDFIKSEKEAEINNIVTIRNKIQYDTDRRNRTNSVTDDIEIQYIIDNWNNYNKKIKISSTELSRLENKGININNNLQYFKELLSKRIFNNLSFDFKKNFFKDLKKELFHKTCTDNNLTIISMIKQGIDAFIPITF